jgi:N-methylhydantoinase A
VCYGRGGTRPTITDAFAAIGVLGRASLGYNAVKVDVDASRRAIEPLAQRLGLDVHRTAAAIIDVAVSGMYGGVSRIVSRFGIDPRTFSLMPFGGAGPMLGGFLARALNMKHLVVPTTPGVLSALGGLIADTKNDFVRTTYYPLDAASLDKLSVDLTTLEKQARDWIVSETGSDKGAEMSVSADMRYRGQSFEVDTPLDPQSIRNGDMATIADAFHREHHRLYGHSDAASPVQVVALRLVISLPTPKPEMPKIAVGEGAPPVEAMIDVYLDDAWRTVPLYHRSALLAGHRFDGPAIIAQDDTTTCVLPGCEAVVDEYGNLLLSLQ